MKPFAALLIILLPVLGWSQLQQEIENIRTEYSLMGISVVTLCNGNVTGTFYSGLRDYARNLPVDHYTQYRIASISKLVTATGLMKLYDEGKFNLDDDVSNHLGFSFRNPTWPEVPITFRMLLSHTSSLQDGSGYSSFLGATAGNPNPPHIQSLLVAGGSYYTSNMWRSEKPGTYFAYSNANFGIVASLIEVLSGQRFDIYMRQQIFEPIEISGSFNIADLADINNVAVLYRKNGGVWSPQVDNFQGAAPTPIDYSNYSLGTNGFLFSPQGGLRCSASDLAKLMQLHLNNGTFNGQQIVSEESISLMHTPQWTFNGSNGDNYYGLFRRWGLGVQITTNTPMGDIVYPNVQMYGHAGEAYGLISDFYFDPAKKAGVIFLTNGAFNGYAYGTNSAFYRVEEDIFDAVNQGSYVSCSTLHTPFADTAKPRLYPNPSDQFINIYLPLCSSHKYRIVDALGKVWLSGEICQSNQSINIGQVPKGVYFVCVYNAQNEIVLRFLKY